jgi:hypothetical protein
MRVGTRFKVACAPITTSTGDNVSWVSEIRYLGVYLVAGCALKFSVSKAKAAFNRAANGILSKVHNVASEEVVLHLIKVKCLPILLYCLHVCDLNRSVIASLDFCVMRFAFRIFKTGRRDIALECLSFMGFYLPSDTLVQRSNVFLAKLPYVVNSFVQYVCVKF